MTIVHPYTIDDATRTEIAELVAHPNPKGNKARPFTLNKNNERKRWYPSVGEAVATGEAFVVTVADDVLAFDLDTSDQVAAGDRLAKELLADGCPTLQLESGRHGHRHLWAVIPDRRKRERVLARGRKYSLTPRQTMRPPLAPHRLGQEVKPLGDVQAWAAEVAAIRASYGHERPRNWHRMLTAGEFGSARHKDPTGSNLTLYIYTALLRAGWKENEIRDALENPNNEGGRCYRTKLAKSGRRRADSWLFEDVGPKAHEWVAKSVIAPADNDEARAELDRIRTLVESQPWPGLGGASERALLLVLIDRGMRDGTTTPTMSHRDLAVLVGCRRATATEATQRLRGKGWLQVLELAHSATELTPNGELVDVALPTRWRIRIPQELEATSKTLDARSRTTRGTPLSSTLLGGTGSRVLADVGRHGGIGLGGRRVIELLAASPESALAATEIATRLKLNAGNVRSRLLPRLVELGLLEVVEGGKVRCWRVVADLENALINAALELGLLGKVETQKTEHDREREGYLEWLAVDRAKRVAKEMAKITPLVVPSPQSEALNTVEAVSNPVLSVAEAFSVGLGAEPAEEPLDECLAPLERLSA